MCSNYELSDQKVFLSPHGHNIVHIIHYIVLLNTVRQFLVHYDRTVAGEKAKLERKRGGGVYWVEWHYVSVLPMRLSAQTLLNTVKCHV